MVYLPQHGAGGSHLKADVPRKVPLAIPLGLFPGEFWSLLKKKG